MPAEPMGRTQLASGPTRVVAIAAGGSLGTLARYGIGRALGGSGRSFPWSTFVVNMAGSFLLGLIVTLVVERWPPTRYVRPFVVIGFCGGFTTFSTMVVDVAQRGQHGQIGLAAGYLTTSVVAGVGAAVLGMAVARGSWAKLGRPIPDPDDVGILRAPGATDDGARQ